MFASAQGQKEEVAIKRQKLRVNLKHPIIVGLNSLRTTDPSLAKEVAEQAS